MPLVGFVVGADLNVRNILCPDHLCGRARPFSGLDRTLVTFVVSSLRMLGAG